MNVPAERIAELLRPYLGDGPIYKLAEELGCNHHVLEEVLNGGRQYVPLATVDKWCTRLERPDWLHVELADLYDTEEEPEPFPDESAKLKAQLAEARARARHWYKEARRFRKEREAWKERWRLAYKETAPARRAANYQRDLARKKARYAAEKAA